MSDGKKKRTAFLDRLADSPYPPVALSNRPMRAAREAVDSHRVWELDPDVIEDTRIADRLNQADVDDLRASIETSGQTVPILVRRHPEEDGRYLLVYGRRRLEAIRSSKEVPKVKALIAVLSDDAAVEAQISENAARRDLTFIEKALFADELLKGGFDTQARIAEVLGVTKSWMSMALSIVNRMSSDLIREIGPAPDIGRPRWELMAKEVEKSELSQSLMIKWIDKTREEMTRKQERANQELSSREMSTVLFDALLKLLVTDKHPPAPEQADQSMRIIAVEDQKAATIKRKGKRLQLSIEPGEFADFVETNADHFVTEMYNFWREEQAKEQKN